MHMQLMTDGTVPVPGRRARAPRQPHHVHRPARVSEAFDLVVRTTPIEPHPKGRTFALVSEARVDGELVWEDVSTMLRRGGNGLGGGRRARGASPLSGRPAASEWKLPERPRSPVRRRSAATATRSTCTRSRRKLFGFPRAIAHGMWTKARALAALEPLPDAYTVDVSFKQADPAAEPRDVRGTTTAVSSCAVRRAPTRSHLEGTVTP